MIEPGAEFECRQGTTFDQSFYYKDDSGGYSSLAGWTGRMQLRNRAGETGTPVCDASSQNNKIVIGQPRVSGDPNAAAHLRVLIPASETALWEQGEYVFDIIITDGTQVRTFLPLSTLRVTRRVTV